MFRFHGGQSVGKGTYWNLSNGERFDAIRNAELPGDHTTHYSRRQQYGNDYERTLCHIFLQYVSN